MQFVAYGQFVLVFSSKLGIWDFFLNRIQTRTYQMELVVHQDIKAALKNFEKNIAPVSQSWFTAVSKWVQFIYVTYLLRGVTAAESFLY